jgi:hypothetical protein
MMYFFSMHRARKSGVPKVSIAGHQKYNQWEWQGEKENADKGKKRN